MADDIEITPGFIESAMRQEAVIKQLGVIAQSVKRRADALAGAEDVSMETWIEESVRPKGRPQAVVYGDNAEQEYGSSRSDRFRIMGRAAEEA